MGYRDRRKMVLKIGSIDKIEFGEKRKYEVHRDCQKLVNSNFLAEF